MTVAAAYRTNDIQLCIYELIDYLTENTSPWTSWEAVLGWPETEVFKDKDAIIYVLEPIPVKAEEIRQQGGLPLHRFELLFGGWVTMKQGGAEEINIMDSTILNFFENPQTVHQQTFTVTLTDGTEQADTTLVNEGIRVEDITGGRWIDTEDVKEYRKEFTLTLKN